MVVNMKLNPVRFFSIHLVVDFNCIFYRIFKGFIVSQGLFFDHLAVLFNKPSDILVSVDIGLQACRITRMVVASQADKVIRFCTVIMIVVIFIMFMVVVVFIVFMVMTAS